MQKTILQADYTAYGSYYQLKLPLFLEEEIPADDPVRLLKAFVEGMDLSDLYSTYDRIRKNQASPRQLFAIVIYAFMNNIRSCREIERACRRDINFRWLLEGMPAPDHSTIARFISLHFSQCSGRILAAQTEALACLDEISKETVFIDGTKIEAYANRYSFVWKKAVTKNQAKRFEKIARFVAECETMYGIKIVHNDRISIQTLKRLRKKLYAIKEAESIGFVYGSGKRKTPLQRSIEQLEEHLEKLKEYNHKLHVCGPRNSYSKTDPDATFMRMKEDHMRNGQLKPAYNVQHAVDAGYIVWLDISPHPTDTLTLRPLLSDMEERLGFRYREVVADAGYESEENYVFLASNGQEAYIKPTNYETSKKRKYKEDIGRRENMIYDEERDEYICHDGRRLKVINTIHRKTKSGFLREIFLYRSEDCSGCPHKAQCIKGNNCHLPIEERTKQIQASKTMDFHRSECMKRITSERGILLRVNRSIQAEGSFATTKEDMGLRQYRYRGKENVLAESILTAIAHNINKLHHKIQGGRTGTYLYDIKRAS